MTSYEFTRAGHLIRTAQRGIGTQRGSAPFCERHGRTASSLSTCLVYGECMARTNIDIDDDACAEVMRRYSLETKREAVNFALRTLAAEPLSVEEARAFRGTGWDGDLDLMRSRRSS